MQNGAVVAWEAEGAFEADSIDRARELLWCILFRQRQERFYQWPQASVARPRGMEWMDHSPYSCDKPVRPLRLSILYHIYCINNNILCLSFIYSISVVYPGCSQPECKGDEWLQHSWVHGSSPRHLPLQVQEGARNAELRAAERQRERGTMRKRE